MGGGVGGYGFHQLLKALTKLKDCASRSPPSGQAEGVPLSGSSSCPTVPSLWSAPGLEAAGCPLVSLVSGSWALRIFEDTINSYQTKTSSCFTAPGCSRLLLLSSGLGLCMCLLHPL